MAAAGLLAAGAAWGASNGPLNVVVTFPPGNSADLVARTVAHQIEKTLKVPLIVENKGGAGGIIGIKYLTRSAPDGKTITITSLSPVSVMPAVKKLPYDPVRQLAPISLLAQGPMVIVVAKNSPFNTLQDLIDYAKAHPGKLNFGSLGRGTISQLTTELFASAAGIKLTEVPYKGSGQALTDLIGGQIDLLFDGNASAMRQIDGGKVKGLAVTIPKRYPMMPNVPAISETPIKGLQDFESQGWMGAFAPAGTPPEVIAKLHDEMQEALKQPQVIQRFKASGLMAVGSDTPADFAKFVEKDRNRWASAAKLLGLEPQD